MRGKTLFIIIFCTVVMAMAFINPTEVFAVITARASVSYSETNATSDAGDSSTWTIMERYSLGIQKSITHTLNFSGTASMTTIETDGSKSSNAYPVFTLDFNPPSAHRFRFGYTRSDSLPSSNSHMTTGTLHASYMHPATRFPSLALNFNRSTTEQLKSPKNVDKVTTALALSSVYNDTFWQTASSFNYSGRYSIDENKVGETKGESISNIISGNFSRAFFDNKIQASMNTGYAITANSFESTGDITRFDAKVALTGLAAPSATITPIPLDIVGGLNDNDTATPAMHAPSATAMDISAGSWNTGADLSTSKEIHTWHVYVAGSALDESQMASNLYNFGWNICSSNNNLVWVCVARNPVYNATFKRYEFLMSGVPVSRYYKVINTATQGAAVNITEVQAIGYVLTRPKHEYTSSTTRKYLGGNLAYAVTPRLGMGLSFNYSNSESESDDFTSTEVSTFAHGLNVTYMAIQKYLSIASSYSSTATESARGIESENTSYGLVFVSKPLDTVRGNISMAITESTSNGTVTSESDSIGTSVLMKLYRGVDTTFKLSMSSSESPQSGSVSNSESMGIGVNLVPRDSMRITMNNTYSEISSKVGGVKSTTDTDSLNMTMSYRASQRLYLSGNLMLRPNTRQSYSATWLPTNNLQAGFTYTIAANVTGKGVNLSWQPIRRTSIAFGYNASETDNSVTGKENTLESLYARASISF